MAVKSPETNYENPDCCTSAFGRIFYAGGSLIYFSQVLTTAKDAGRCYQNNDPTSEDIPDLLDTDGGVVTLEESVKIKALKQFKSGVLVFATNGVWYIYNPDGGFKATAFNVAKVSERGIENPRSIVEAEGSVYYFSNNGIMMIAASEFDVLQSQDITEQTIRGYFLKTHAGRGAQGVYDEPSKQIVWWNPDLESKGLILDVELGAFFPQQQSADPWSIARPFKVANSVFYPAWRQDDENNRISYAISQPTSDTFEDFQFTIDAYMVSGWETLGKFANRKRANMVKVYFRKTETKITGYDNGEYVFDKPSGCLFQSRWDYDNSNAYNKWVGGTRNLSGGGRRIQLYRPMQRGFIPDEFPYNFDTGESVVQKKISVRGSGDAVQFVFEAEPQKDMKILGYSVSFDMGARM